MEIEPPPLHVHKISYIHELATYAEATLRGAGSWPTLAISIGPPLPIYSEHLSSPLRSL